MVYLHFNLPSQSISDVFHRSDGMELIGHLCHQSSVLGDFFVPRCHLRSSFHHRSVRCLGRRREEKKNDYKRRERIIKEEK